MNMKLGPPYIIKWDEERQCHTNVSGGLLQRMLNLPQNVDFMVNGKLVKRCDLVLHKEQTEYFPIWISQR